MKVQVIIAVFLTILLVAKAQYHYVPAQILIPTLNLSNLQAYNNNSHNPNGLGWISPPLNWTNWHTPPLHNPNRTGWNNPQLNRTFSSNRTNLDGHLIVGTIGYMDRLLFNQVSFQTS